jgi:orotate phosphoribosyltransferase
MSYDHQKSKADLIRAIISLGAYKEGDFTLSSGKKSSFYIDIKKIALSSVGLPLILEMLYNLIPTEIRNVGGVELGAIPLIAGASVYRADSSAVTRMYNPPLQLGYNLLAIRKQPKEYGTNSQIEGLVVPGEDAIVLEDVTTTGASSMKAVQLLRDAGLFVNKVITVVDRQEGAEMLLNTDLVALVSLVTISELKAEFAKQ